MATTTINLHVRGSEKMRADANAEAVYLYLEPDAEDEPTGTPVTIFLPHADEDALLAIELLEGVLDNAKSLVELRQSRRLRDGIR